MVDMFIIDIITFKMHSSSTNLQTFYMSWRKTYRDKLIKFRLHFGAYKTQNPICISLVNFFALLSKTWGPKKLKLIPLYRL